MPHVSSKYKQFKRAFTLKLTHWHLTSNKRTMPWKGEKDPYKIWISEIILQQTRVEQGLEYYKKFVREFPTVGDLAKADDALVYKLWEGLGYYSRCKNLLFTARKIYFELEGKFPTAYENILALKGVGPYTAAAISSFAYGLPHAVVDGNVFRVLSRYFGEAIPIDSNEGKRHFTLLANELLDKEASAEYNQAIMDFGATVCKPQIPECQSCILNRDCIAYNNGLVNKLPVKEKRLIRTKRFFTYFIFKIENKVLVSQRTEKDIWQNLHEFYLYESEKGLKWTKPVIDKWLKDQLGIQEYHLENISGISTQQLTHQSLSGRFITIRLYEVPTSLSHFIAADKEAFDKIAFPKFINQYLQAELSILPW